ncbi:MAG: LysR family transcriptional regulator [Sulfurimonas sp. RIFOXYD12_FULL_33_39]|uniref:LysR family transcriptional regulator n=1 Tax=unclassified Sulfurimonas TaxID=2623549 RepID=UPI0008AB314D|nr:MULTISPECIES: LysR family transcriptional regulator [unclassified Sulfurimonas]OHE06332.1 MAG: LysR family transcriptional regulator [Sulfurimonas sp. RIFCSPLOWO2_12_FULL_34_6]OHE09595.1 MAG: LysR family transcriptional regulator [Sulfurimonas sp. RIFOXYD12_FULL_33_39]OHE13898.1 MAG: LysR family transcriptional regulator [Sulfurimonas sp. RIFOXYD2_FULL_34_21]DAB28554.1 MAG TPA: LysR family transcriptional regulator [Sulfurimonas sp. UBA10385]
MLKDFAKLQTFLMVIKEKSFSKASAKLGISQPAVTQQIKFIEDYLDTRIVERKKNGILLTKEGEDLFRIALRLEKAITNSEKELLKIINKDFTFIMGSSNAIGNYILPNYLGEIKKRINNNVYMNVGQSSEIIDQLEDKKIDVALIESPVFRDGIIYREWVLDELVVFSNQPLKKHLTAEDLMGFNWICRDEHSHTRKLTSEVFDEMGVQCNNFHVLGILGSPTAIKESILHADANSERPVVSVMSRHVIAAELADGRLFEARLKNYKIERSFYIAYSKERKHDAFVDNVVNYLLSLNKV